MADLRGTLIHTDRDLSLDPAPRGAIEPAQDLFLHALDHHPEDEEDAEIAQVAMEAAEEDEAQVIAATAVMTIGAGAEAVDVVAVADVRRGTLDFTALEFGMARKL